MSEKKSKVKFVRIRGKVVPIKSSGKNSETKKPPVKRLVKKKSTRQTIAGVSALAGATLLASKFKTRTLVEGFLAGASGGFLGSLVGGGIANIKYTKRAKGESKEQVAKRVSMGNKKYNKMYGKKKK